MSGIASASASPMRSVGGGVSASTSKLDNVCHRWTYRSSLTDDNREAPLEADIDAREANGIHGPTRRDEK
jgi:hypothetical protein